MISAKSEPGRRWPTVRSWHPWELFLECSRTERLDTHQIAIGQHRQLQELVQHARAFVPYYQEALAHVPEEDVELHELPLLSRATLRERRSDFTPRRLPAGMTLAGGAFTSGTTGEPVHINYTSAQRAWYTAHLLRALEWAGLRQSKKFAAIRYIEVDGRHREQAPEIVAQVHEAYMRGVELESWDPSLAGIVETGPGFGMDVEQDPRVQYQWLKRTQPNYLLSHASNLRQLAELFRQHGAIPSLEAVISIAEALPEEDRWEIESCMQLEVIDVYSCREVGYVASQCVRCGYYHVYDDNVILEVLDDDDQPCRPGETGRVVLTGLHSFATPIIRYEVGDRATLNDNTDVPECWRIQGLGSLLAIDGRQLPSFRMLDGTRKDPMRLVSQVRQAAPFEELVQFCIEQTANAEVVVSAVGAPGFHLTDFSEAVTKAVWEFFDTQQVRVKTNLCHRLPLSESGKSPPVVRCSV